MVNPCVSCATVPLEIGVAQQPHHSSNGHERDQSLLLGPRHPLVSRKLLLCCPFSSCPIFDPRRLDHWWHPDALIWTRHGRNTKRGHSELESIKGHASANRINSPSEEIPLLKPSMLIKRKEWLRFHAIPCNSFLPACHPDNLSNVTKSTSFISC